ncbi:hypothetical protein JK151_08855 [Ralstonia syzygii subsp. celebesensis]|uniref:Phage protein n=2 Tax=Ralstonia syzygii subsp. celebesensis TaxID=1310168 RepID=A0A1U9VEM5_9RALS|nr:hypothetical protein [Ralstonia syzygii]AQW29128.1 hypothetical protein B0B51_03265 [blood disease bacterium A2-HR MARDI]QQV54330.1 hypothetical protein JK151_08855 [Ralstonia syzygii subsp. celebesensis]
MGAGVAANTVGSYFSAQQQKTALGAQAGIDDINARMAESGAQSALYQGQQQEIASRMRTAQLKSSQRTALAANGVDLGSDSAVNVLTSTDVMGGIDANTIAANAVRAAFGYRTQATNFQNDALMKRASASAISPIGSAAGTLLSSAGQVAGNWYLMKKNGLFDTPASSGSGSDMGFNIGKDLG